MSEPWNTLRQLIYPPEFRIAPSVWPPGLLTELRQLTDRLATPLPAVPPGETDQAQIQMQRLADIGTGLWRLKQKMIEPGTDRPLEEMQRAYRHFKSVWDALAEATVEIQDHTGDSFDSGLSLKVIAFQATRGIEREQVVETIKPSIYFDGKRIQMGEVIVGTPATDDYRKPDAQPSTGTTGTGSEQSDG